MNRAVIALLLLAIATALSPVILITPQNHQAVLNSQQLLQYLADQPAPILAELGPVTENDLASVRSSLKTLPIDKHRVSSFLATSYSLEQLKTGLATQQVESKTLKIEEVLSLLEAQNKPIIITANIVAPTVQRILVGTPANNTADSQIFDNMTPAALSGLFVGLFLLVMLGIAISCLFDLKTHDKFARQNLWVGRES